MTGQDRNWLVLGLRRMSAENERGRRARQIFRAIEKSKLLDIYIDRATVLFYSACEPFSISEVSATVHT